MGFLQSMGLGQFGRGQSPWGAAGVTPYEWHQQQMYPQGPDPNDPRPQRGDFQPMDDFQAKLAEWTQRQPPGSVDPGRPGAWRPMPPQQPQGMPGGYGGAPMPPMGQGQMPWQPQGQLPQFGPFQGTANPGGAGRYWGQQFYGGGTVDTHGRPVPNMAPLSQYPQFGQGGGWGGFGGALGGMFGMRR